MTGSTTASPAAKPCPESGWRGRLTATARLILAAVFLMAAVTKFTDLAGFENRLVLHIWLPVALARTAAFWVPSLELTCGFCLLFNQAVREAAVLVACLLILFMALPLSPAGADCGCLIWPGGGDKVLPLPRNLALLAGSLWLALVPDQRRRASRRKPDVRAAYTAG